MKQTTIINHLLVKEQPSFGEKPLPPHFSAAVGAVLDQYSAAHLKTIVLEWHVLLTAERRRDPGYAGDRSSFLRFDGLCSALHRLAEALWLWYHRQGGLCLPSSDHPLSPIQWLSEEEQQHPEGIIAGFPVQYPEEELCNELLDILREMEAFDNPKVSYRHQLLKDFALWFSVLAMVYPPACS